jgi:Tol biopolymer transport system component
MSLAAGARLGPYEILAPLGAGGMGEVWSARDTRLGREVAIKVLPPEFALDGDRLGRFEQEARTVSALSHANILTVFDVGEHDGIRFLVLELLEGSTLRDALRDGALPARHAIEVGAQIARGLAAAHSRGVVHRDLKPENIFLTGDGVAKILDFGLAKQIQPELSGADLADAATQLETAAGIVLGTVGYMAPEQVRGERTDSRADVFSFGAVLYELLSGRRAFRGATAVETLNAILKEEPPPLAETHPGLPAAGVRVVERCLAKDPARRFQSAADLAFALESAALPTSSTSTAAVLASQDQPPRPRLGARSGWVGAGAAAALIVASAGAGLWIGATSRRAPDAPVRRFQVDLQADSGSRGGYDTIFRPVISPDGRSVAFTREGKLWLRDLSQVDPRVIAGTEGAIGPFWSPGGESVAFVTGSALKRVDIRSGAVTTIGSLPPGNFTGGSWSPSGAILIGVSGLGLYEVAELGGTAKLVLAPDRSKSEFDFHSPHYLPDGRSFLFVLHPLADSRYSLRVRSNGTTRVLVDASSQIAACGVYDPRGYLLFERIQKGKTILGVPFSLGALAISGEPFVVAEGAGGPSVSRDGTLLFASGGSTSSQELVVVDRAGRPEEVADEPFDQIRYPAFSPDASRIAFSGTRDGNSDIWVFDRGRKTTTRVTALPELDEEPAWSRSGDRLAFASGPTLSAGIFVKSADGSGEPERLTPAGQNARSPVWTLDDKHLLYRGRTLPDGKQDLWIVPSDGSAAPRVLNGRDDGSASRLSPNGTYEAYVSSQSGRAEVYVRSFPGGSIRSQVSSNGGRHPRWNRAGDELFYQNDNVLMVVSVSTGAEFRAGIPSTVFAGDAAGLLLYSFGPGVSAYDVAPDGQHIVALRARGGLNKESVTVVENWLREFRK